MLLGRISVLYLGGICRLLGLCGVSLASGGQMLQHELLVGVGVDGDELLRGDVAHPRPVVCIAVRATRPSAQTATGVGGIRDVADVSQLEVDF